MRSIISAAIEDIFPSIPILYLTMLIALLVLFLTIQDFQIFNDALTGLNNRERLESFLGHELQNASVSKPIAIFMIDVDKFKLNNDIYGHVEGDYALKQLRKHLKIQHIKIKDLWLIMEEMNSAMFPIKVA